MLYVVKFEKEAIGSVVTNQSMTDEEICEMAGVELAITEQDFEEMPENGKYDLDELDIVATSESRQAIATIETEAGKMVIYYNGAGEEMTAESEDGKKVEELESNPEDLEDAKGIIYGWYGNGRWGLEWIEE